MNTDSSNPVALVTGGGSGIGRELVHLLLENDHDVVVVGRTESTLRETAEAAPDRVLVVSTDIRRPESCKDVVERALAHHGRIDVLVNNARTAPLEKIQDTSPDVIQDCLEINLAAPMHLLVGCWPHFISQRSGCVINISSMASIDPFPGFLAYAASKSGLDSVTRSIIAEGATFGIRGFTINPGAVETSMLRANFNKTFLPEEFALHPEEIARFAIECINGEHDPKQGSQNQISRT